MPAWVVAALAWHDIPRVKPPTRLINSVIGGTVLACAVLAAAAGAPPEEVGPAAALRIGRPAPLLPFSEALLPAPTAGGREIAQAVCSLQDVAAARVAVSLSGGRPRVVVTIRWRRSPRPETVRLIADIVRHLAPEASPNDILIADTSGRLWFRGGEVVVNSSPPGASRTGAVVVFLGLCAAALAAVAWRRRFRARPSVTQPEFLRERSPKQLAALLQDASPAVRGAILAGMPDDVRVAVSKRLRGDIQLPPAAPAPAVVMRLLEALECVSPKERRPREAKR
ncbi:MAG: hypothetical protein H5T86_02910 [Armatimonadetes bacterium]|nr:hypothetical protein [Armatimonadota bacterium]